MKITGVQGAIIELSLFFICAYTIRDYFSLYEIHNFAYYWLMFTILTGIWEFTYVLTKKQVSKMSQDLINSNEHVWTNVYNLSMVLPWNLSKVFYSEYGAYADREYMTVKDKWTIVIEGTHAFFCAVFSFIAIMSEINNYTSDGFYIAMGAGMGTQLMNSILYMSEYLIQTRDPNNINYNTKDFPCGPFMLKRPFMYINIFWTIMPLFIIYSYLYDSYHFANRESKSRASLFNNRGFLDETL